MRAELKALRAQWPEAQFMRDDERAKTLVDIIWGHKSATLPLAVCGTNFQVQVWRALLELDPGETVTYSALARQLGHRMLRGPSVMQLARIPSPGSSPVIVCCEQVVNSADIDGESRANR